MKTTLLDYPGYVAAAIFAGGCNFRCPFCQNGDLVLHCENLPLISTEEIVSHLKRRRNLLDGVCITGGEPTLAPDLEDFVREIRSLGYLVKLDTNGYRPDVLIRLCEQGLLDYVAMDIKHAPEQYNQIACMADFDPDRIKTSVAYLRSCSVPHEFRTTLVREFHTADSMLEIGEWLSGPSFYYLQPYRDSPNVISTGLHAHDADTLRSFVRILSPMMPNTFLRGM